MYGDCQVLSAMGMGGNVVVSCSPDSLFGASSPIRNPNLNFLTNLPYNPFSAIIPKEEAGLQSGGGSKEEDIETGGSVSGHVDGASADEQDLDQPKPKKKRYHRHSARQIQEMEALFKVCPHPDDKQRNQLSQELRLKPRQVKFWFQNRRTQMKAQQDRSENTILRAENENLKTENYRLQAALRSLNCPNCGGPAILGEMSFEDQHLHMENARLKEELERISFIVPLCGGRSMNALGTAPPLIPPSVDLGINIYPRHFQDQMGTCTNIIPAPSLQENSDHAACNLIMEQDKHLVLDLAMNAMDELIKMCQMNEPLWIKNADGIKEMLNMEHHSKMFPWPNNFKQHHGEFRTEATRGTAVVIMNSITLADAFLDANKWMDIFPSIVSRAKTVQILTSGISGHAGGSLQLMLAELQVLSPLVPTREAHFIRYCQQNDEEGTWAIVDFPIDNIHSFLQHSFPRYRRRPSGCIIQDTANGYSKVTWVEHAEVEDKPVHQIFNHFVDGGTAFGAHRWLAVLEQQCQRLARLMARNIPDLGVIPSPEARKNLMKLTQRMIRIFCFNISTAGGQSWTALSGSADNTVRITTRSSITPGQPNGLILCAASTTWLPFPHQQVFELLRDERRRSQLDILSSETSTEEVAHIANGSHPGNCISLLRINACYSSSQNVELMLQESSTNESSSLVVYSMIDVTSVRLAMSGQDPECIPLLPLGFVITPMNKSSIGNSENTLRSSEDENVAMSGCLLTVGLQVLTSTIPSAKINLSNINAMNNHICKVVHQISVMLHDGSSTEPPPLKSE